MSRIGLIILHWHNTKEVSQLIRGIDSWEVNRYIPVIVDNSNDWQAKAFNESMLVVRPGKNVGFAAGCNVGMKAAFDEDCDFILLLNADISIEESDVLKMKREMENDPKLAAVAPVLKEEYKGQVVFHKGGRDPLRDSNTRVFDKSLESSHDKIFYLPGTVLLLRREAIEEVGLFDEAYFFSGEVADWFMRLDAPDWTFKLVDQVVVQHYSTGNEDHRRRAYIYYSLRNRYLLIRKFGGQKATSLASQWTKRLMRQWIGALVRLDRNQMQVVYHAMRDGKKNRFGKSTRF